MLFCSAVLHLHKEQRASIKANHSVWEAARISEHRTEQQERMCKRWEWKRSWKKQYLGAGTATLTKQPLWCMLAQCSGPQTSSLWLAVIRPESYFPGQMGMYVTLKHLLHLWSSYCALQYLLHYLNSLPISHRKTSSYILEMKIRKKKKARMGIWSIISQ